MKFGTLLSLAALVAATSSASAAVSVFDFNGDFAPTSGPSTMDLFNGSPFGTFGTAMIGGQSTGVYAFDPAAPKTQGLQVTDNVPPNGGGAYINQYTIGYDIMLTGGAGYASLFQTSPTDSNDGDLFRGPNGGVGISAVYDGSMPDDTWNRVVFAFDLADQNGDGQRLYKYINGALVGTQALDGLDGRWSLDPTFLLLADDDGETSAGQISSFMFADTTMSADEIAALGGPTAAGFGGGSSAIPEPGTLALLGLGALATRLRRRR